MIDFKYLVVVFLLQAPYELAGVLYLVEQLPYCDLLRALLTSLFGVLPPPGWNPLPNLGVRHRPESSKSWVSETVPLKAEHSFVVLPFLFGQVQGGIHCLIWARDLSLET